MDNASELTDGSAALAVYANKLGFTEASAIKSLDTKLTLEDRLKDCKTRLQAMLPVFEQEEVSPRDFTKISIGYFERLLRKEILKTVHDVPGKDAYNYLGAIEAVEQNLLQAKNALNLALDELDEVEKGGNKGAFYKCLDECAKCLRTVLDRWDVPPLSKNKGNQIAHS